MQIGTSDSKGVMILVAKGTSCSKGRSITDPNGRFFISEFTVDQCKFIICNIYAPNVDSPAFFQQVESHLVSFDNTNIIMGGDFNFVINPILDRKFSHCNNDKARNTFMEIVENHELIDVWRALNGDAKQYSCCQPNSDSAKWKKFSRLDMFFVSSGFINHVSKSVMQTGFESDHSFVIFDINFLTEKRGAGYWKFNSAFLYEKSFVTAANAIIEEQLVRTDLNPDLHWQAIKGAFIEFSKKYGCDRAKQKRTEFQQVETILDNIKIMIEELPFVDENTKEEFEKAQAKRDSLLLQKVQGIIMRSKEKFYEQGERSSKYYFSLEKNNARKKIMTRIRNSDDHLITNQKEILLHQSKYFRKLYKSNAAIQFKLNNTLHRKLTVQQKGNLEAEISLGDLTEAVKSMANNKSPGLDGLTVEVYKMFWAKIGRIYHKAILFAKEQGTLNLAMRRGVITLLPKRDRDQTYIENWRPITLLNCDYKILSKALALRLQTVLPSLISFDQTGFMKGRNIVDNIRKTIEAVNHSYMNKQKSLIMTTDYQKCFDMLEHSAIWGSLRYFGFGEEYIS